MCQKSLHSFGECQITSLMLDPASKEEQSGLHRVWATEDFISQKYISHLIKKQMGSQWNLWGQISMLLPLIRYITTCWTLRPLKGLIVAKQARGSKGLDSARRSCVWMKILATRCLRGNGKNMFGQFKYPALHKQPRSKRTSMVVNLSNKTQALAFK